ncbi:laccase domain-containing protein, partial [Streptomyces sp. G35A]
MIGQRESVSGAHFAFTDRWGGVSAAPYEELNLGGAVGDDPGAVRTNRELAATSLGVDPARVVWMNQVHGADAVVVEEPWGDRPVPGVDAIVTARRGLALAVLTADCVPVLLADPVAGVAAAAHAQVPLVAIDPVNSLPSTVPSIGSTNWAGGHEATTHLLGLG